MTATATIQQIWCLRQATGTDLGVVQALSGLAPAQVLSQLGVSSIESFVRGIPEVVGAMDSARSDPDNLFITTDTSGDLDNSIWPHGNTTVDVQAGQSLTPGITLPVSFSQNISLFDHDSASGNDLLGSITIFESERGAGEIAKLAKSEVESSYYYVTYRVD
ncbi:hypothetical protein ACIBQX_32595 [Nonomuraea sp. NPDC049714]|uniref:hypothetical protein n=1 Tax=Nonomuraea sp. NPDC049714 TaxID=3364357 RepID=UPI0037A5EC6B